MLDEITIGKLAVLLAVSSDAEEKEILQKGEQAGYKLFKGRVGSMDGEKIFAAVETAAKRREIIENQYREEHALYHSILDAFHGVCRGELALGSVLRSVGLVFSVVRGPRMAGD